MTILAHIAAAAAPTVIGWNDLGMHCMDADYSVFSILPPYNNPHAQVLDANGNLVTATGTYHLTYEGIADASGSINTTSVGKTNFWEYVQALFGTALSPDAGLAGNSMPGMANTPQPLGFESAYNWFLAKGVPITPTDDAGKRNTYPLMKIAVRDSGNNVLAYASIVLPVSDEMTCTACHASGSGQAAEPSSGWVYDANAQKDYRLNILKLHDDRNLGSALYTQALQAAGYHFAGLYANVVQDGKPILCDKCHPSNALPVSVASGVSPLTQAVHGSHAQVTDPTTGASLDASTDRSACYRCHPGSLTRCLRGAMGSATAPDGSYLIQCQDCHGTMSSVGAPSRQGWLDEPTCQNCHTGTASNNNGQIRYTTVFDTNGQPRVAVDPTFATNSNTPATGLSLYRFSSGHGGMQCEACHNSTHAELPSSTANDNVQSLALQGHEGMLSECSACHGKVPSTVVGGPHGLHPVGQSWVDGHQDAAGGGAKQCQDCHGTDYKGSVLSRALADRSGSGLNVWQGYQISCYLCHNGSGGGGSPVARAHANNASASAAAGVAVNIPLTATDPGGHSLTLRIVSQPSHGRAGLSGTTAVYISDDAFSGTDTFTFAAWNGYVDSNLATVTVAVTGPPCTLDCTADVPGQGSVGSAVSFTGSSTALNCSNAVTYAWDFGDGSTPASTEQAAHAYTSTGAFTWTFTAVSGTTTCSKTGIITIADIPSNPQMLFLVHTPGNMGAQWRSALTITNLTSEAQSLNATYAASQGVFTQTLALPAGAVLRWADATQDLFAVAGDTYGVLQLHSTGAVNLSSRIYTQGTDGTFGQSFYGVGPSQASSAGLVPDLKNSAQFRSNVGFLNLGDTPASITVTVVDDQGAAAGTPVAVDLNPQAWTQINDLFAQAQASAVPSGYAHFQASSGAVWAYGSVVDNGTNDPTSLPMIPIPSIGPLALAAGSRTANPGMVEQTRAAVRGSPMCERSPAANSQMLFLVHTPGNNGAHWLSALTLTNPSTTPQNITAVYTSGSNTYTVGLTLDAGAVQHWEDATGELFGISDDTYGVLQVDSDGPTILSSRIFTEGAGGSFGQSFYGVTATQAGATGLVPDLLNSTVFRSNVGFMNLSGTDATVSASLYDDQGSPAGPAVTQYIPAHGWVQVSDIFSQVPSMPGGYVRFQASGGNVWAYGSVVDNGTNDPTSLPMVAIP